MKNHRFYFRTLAQELDDLVFPYLVIVLGRRRPEFHFLDVRGFLMLLLLVRLFILLVEEFTEIDELADWRHSVGGDFHNIDPLFPRGFHRVEEGHHPELVPRFINNSHFARSDALVNPQTTTTFSDKPTSRKSNPRGPGRQGFGLRSIARAAGRSAKGNLSDGRHGRPPQSLAWLNSSCTKENTVNMLAKNPVGPTERRSRIVEQGFESPLRLSPHEQNAMTLDRQYQHRISRAFMEV
jgi:hypothetical protein